jgi:hypothetical protein
LLQKLGIEEMYIDAANKALQRPRKGRAAERWRYPDISHIVTEVKYGD